MNNRPVWLGVSICVLAAASSGCCCVGGGYGGFAGYGSGGVSECRASSCGECCAPSYGGGGCCGGGDVCCGGGCSDGCCGDGCCEFGAGGYRWGWSPDCGWADMRYAHTGFLGHGPGGGPIMALFNVIGQSMWCGSGCGSTYAGEWHSDPPACCDPCGGWGGGGGGCSTCSRGGSRGGGVSAQPRHPFSNRPSRLASQSQPRRTVASTCADGSCRFRDGSTGEVYYEQEYEDYGQTEKRPRRSVAGRTSRGTRVVRTSSEDVRYR